MAPKLSKGEALIQVDPARVRFMHAKIRPVFSDGRRLEDTLADIVSGKVKVEDIPQIVVIQVGSDQFYSMNNRRLWVFKQLRDRGLLPDNLVTVRVR
eukprot:EC719635.1.p1 GENE.EC719635.1~~EC719635.1.p1  ORF type:complete len:97 (+),score=3.53 EC719635.1:113-403(+)